jgi:hypothetical protein
MILAGMPSPLPSEDDLELVQRLTGSAEARLQVVSFFLVGLLLSALAVKLLWNAVARGLPALPRLSFGRALAGVVLWGLVFVLVLTMISGARELMTPGAWKKQGFTYKLADDADSPPAALRRRALGELRQALWHFAATHGGRFPSADEATALDAALWEVPETGGLRFRYAAGPKPGDAAPLVTGPAFDGKRLVLRADGTVAEESP